MDGLDEVASHRSPTSRGTAASSPRTGTQEAGRQGDICGENNQCVSEQELEAFLLLTIRRRIDAALDLRSNTTGVFTVATVSSNAPLSVGVKGQPVNSTLGLTAETSNGAVELSVPPAFEGEVIAGTSNSKVDLVKREDEEDPTGLDRERIVDVQSFGPWITGGVYWGEKRKVGSVVAKTSNSGVKIVV